jgi:hypothetical protein
VDDPARIVNKWLRTFAPGKGFWGRLAATKEVPHTHFLSAVMAGLDPATQGTVLLPDTKKSVR